MKKMPDHFVWVTAKVTIRTRRELRVLVIDKYMRERSATLSAPLLQGEREVAHQPEYRELLVPARWAHQHRLETGPVQQTHTRLQEEDYSNLEQRVLALQASGQAPGGFNLPPLPTVGLTTTSTGRQPSQPAKQWVHPWRR